ncbi:MAG: LytTR family DNA-binding domain-containing protein [Pseudomonadota bacterium]
MGRPKDENAGDATNLANDTAMSLTLRQLQETLSGPVFWLVTVVAVFLAAMAGPFYTLERLSFPERLVYWGVTIVCSATVMTFISIYAYRATEARGLHWLISAILAGAIGTVPVVLSVYLAEGAATGFAAGWASDISFGALAIYTAPSVIATTVIVNLIIERQARERAEPTPAPSVERGPHRALTLLQSKLPAHLGHEVIAVQAQDHYVEVTTPKGAAMVLMRLSDAVGDLEPLGGMQVHRSWWINLSHIERTEKGPNGPELLLSSGQKVPVGRSYRVAFRKAAEAAATGDRP